MNSVALIGITIVNVTLRTATTGPVTPPPPVPPVPPVPSAPPAPPSPPVPPPTPVGVVKKEEKFAGAGVVTGLRFGVEFLGFRD